MKRLVVCCDGTWNTPDQASGGEASPTNITKIALQVAERDAKQIEQRVYYDRGVGTGRLDHLTGGVFGAGLSKNVKQAYGHLVECYEPDDEVYLFGFSRGAYTARSLAGLIRNSGLLRPECRHKIDQAYALYRDRTDETHPTEVAATLFRRTWSREVPVHFIGVFDTVGALGVPGVGLHLLTRRWQFHDTELSSSVRHAAHALALHERRGPFRPTLWTEAPGRADPVRQVWFTGVHSDVGGGYAEPDLAEIPLRWMVERASAAGLEFSDGAFGPLPDRASAAARGRGSWTAPSTWGIRHDTWHLPYRLLQPFDREFRDDRGGVQQVSGTARTRDAGGVESDRPPTHASFAAAGVCDVGTYPDHPGLPVGTTMTARVRAARRRERTGIVLVEGGTYEITATGTWCDRSTVAGPAGYPSRSRVLRWAEWLRRAPDQPWFALMGQVGDSTFPIGARFAGHVAPASGELVCWANDVRLAYGNNSGAVELTVTRTS